MSRNKKYNINDVYSEVLKLVKIGATIEEACRKSGISRAYLYRNITKDQNRELMCYKSTTLIHGTPRHYGTSDFMTLEPDED